VAQSQAMSIARTLSASSAYSQSSDSSHLGSRLPFGHLDFMTVATNEFVNSIKLQSQSSEILESFEVNIVKSTGTLRWSKKLLAQMRYIRTLLGHKNDSTKFFFEKRLIQILIGNSKKVMDHASLTDEALRCFLRMLNSVEMRDYVLEEFLNVGGLIFCLAITKKFAAEYGICLKSTFILASAIDKILRVSDNFHPYGKTEKSAIQTSSPNKYIYQLVSNGATSILPHLLDAFVNRNKMKGVRPILTGFYHRK